ncbi:hypothetical protein N7468_001952 [Penicillium chermesinum]|uniref:Uncharacterized protein n=1 Tax=Penicillium chermesinum TaxID=63820 RepID=A0A9W9TZ44_9EURO|nr:uncharacterized protein N7468_001952 [Penicillium chermesinum]KAJ5246969.1 hypothetical protein N7468_001952 [Penicillium chermesinum]KAJ6145221.1 hypothetical protein N7470_009116 [Penicillium chermesinum]
MENLSSSNSEHTQGTNGSAGTHQTHSPEPIEPVTDTEFPLVARLTQGLELCDWEKLQDKYSDAMDEHTRVEEDLRSQTAKLLEAFTAWSQITVLQDENRALKRFKTQMQHVQNSEMSVESKKKHYEDVVKAFQNALALLNAQMKA